jgi:hypothetical protein
MYPSPPIHLTAAGLRLTPEGCTRGPMKKIPAHGGPVQTTCKLPEMPHGIAWLNDREIVWARWMGPLMLVSVDGGPSRTLTKLAAGQAGHRLLLVLAGESAILSTPPGRKCSCPGPAPS